MRFVLFALLFCSLCLVSPSVRAQGAANDEKPRTIFEQLFPHPTGMNGYEELMIAADIARASPILTDAMQTDATLTLKRKALEDLNVRRALALIRVAFLKPIISPRDRATMDANTLFPDYAMFRNLARLLSIAEYVALADGNVSVALDIMEDCLHLGHAIPVETIIGDLVSVAIDAIALKLVAQHTTQLSVRNCEQLERICETWLAAPDSLPAIMVGERDMLVNTLRAQKPKPDEILQMVTELSDGDAADITPEEAAFRTRLMEHPEDVGKILGQVTDAITTYYNGYIAETKKSAWERKPVQMPALEPSLKFALEAVTPTMQPILDKHDSDKANLHMLGTFAALQHYRWLHRRFPDALKDLRQPFLTQDPYTGEFLIYKLTEDAYDLHSAGPLSEETKTRTPLYLPYRKN